MPHPCNKFFTTPSRRPLPPLARIFLIASLFASLLTQAQPAPSPSPSPIQSFESTIRPLLKEFCYDCHADGSDKGKVSFDNSPPSALLQNLPLWLAVLKNLEAGMMPPPKKSQPSTAQKKAIAQWIKSDLFQLDPAQPDPGRITLRRLNRTEYKNTIRDLMGIEFDTDQEFPSDDTGHGFDNIADVLTISPMLLEKYLASSRRIVDEAVPASALVVAEHRVQGSRFIKTLAQSATPASTNTATGAPTLSYYQESTASAVHKLDLPGQYQIILEITAQEKFIDGQFDLNRCKATFQCNNETIATQEFTRENGRSFKLKGTRDLAAGNQVFTVHLEPLTPKEKQVRSLSLRIDGVTLRGPSDPKHWVTPKNYERFFGKKTSSSQPPDQIRDRTRSLLKSFAEQAFRRPVETETLDRLTAMATSASSQPEGTFETGMRQAMTAILASPRFLFREESTEPLQPGEKYPKIDEFSLASRLSYFLWATMPDPELRQLASKGKLRAELKPQIQRMIRHDRFQAFIKSFVGQWLQVRDVESIAIDHKAVMGREMDTDPAVESARKRFRELRDREPNTLTPAEKEDLNRNRDLFFKSFGRFNSYELTGDLRRAMRQETEKYVEFVIRENRNISELLHSDYTFLNQKLADYYGIPGVTGDTLRRVTIPASSGRGGILTHGTVLVVTSNPTRTSPVKRGLFILENILGTPPPPPPPDIPPLEDAAKKAAGKSPSLRETLAIHRENPLCSSCHNRMDPLGLALENFNALGRWRDQEQSHPIDPSGKLITGESFRTIQEVKRLLSTERLQDFYHCLSEKLLIYALGRGLDHRDLTTLEQLTHRLQDSQGSAIALLETIIESAPFQRRSIATKNNTTASLPLHPDADNSSVAADATRIHMHRSSNAQALLQP